MKILKGLLLSAITAALMSFDLPSGWIKAGNAVESYDIGIDKDAGRDGKIAVTIKSIDKEVKGFGSLMQTCLAEKFIVRRIRLSGHIKSKDVADWAGFWLRVDQEGTDKPMSFDNMFDRPIKGTTDWKKYEIVVDVPAKASTIQYGALLSGTGQIWFDQLNFEIVDNSVETTGTGNAYSLPQREPTNLGFEK